MTSYCVKLGIQGTDLNNFPHLLLHRLRVCNTIICSPRALLNQQLFRFLCSRGDHRIPFDARSRILGIWDLVDSLYMFSTFLNGVGLGAKQFFLARNPLFTGLFYTSGLRQAPLFPHILCTFSADCYDVVAKHFYVARRGE